MIPKKIHYCWLSGEPFPPLVLHCINSWKKYLPDYELILWDADRIDIEMHFWVKQAFEKEKYAFASDYIRLYALYKEGGIYLDSDVEVVKTFDPLLCKESFIGTESSGDFEAAIIGSAPGAKWILRCLEYYQHRTFIRDDGTLDVTPLPLILGRILAEEYGVVPALDLVRYFNPPGVSVYPSSYFSPKSIYSAKLEINIETISIHHFDGAWVKKNCFYYMKKYTHSLLIFLFGQRVHNIIVKTLRNN